MAKVAKPTNTGAGFGVDFVEGDIKDGAAGFVQAVVWDRE